MSEQRWSKLSYEALQGANYALRVLHTSPRIRGAALELLKGLIEETYVEMGARKPEFEVVAANIAKAEGREP